MTPDPTVTAVSINEQIIYVQGKRAHGWSACECERCKVNDATVESLRELLRARSALSPSPAPVTSDELLSLVLAQAGHDGTITPALHERIDRHVARSALADVGEKCSRCDGNRYVEYVEPSNSPDLPDDVQTFPCPDCTGKQPRPSTVVERVAKRTIATAEFQQHVGKQPRPAAEVKCARCGDAKRIEQMPAPKGMKDKSSPPASYWIDCPDCSPAAHTAQLTPRALSALRTAALVLEGWAGHRPCSVSDTQAAEALPIVRRLAEQGSGAKP